MHKWNCELQQFLCKQMPVRLQSRQFFELVHLVHIGRQGAAGLQNSPRDHQQRQPAVPKPSIQNQTPAHTQHRLRARNIREPPNHQQTASNGL